MEDAKNVQLHELIKNSLATYLSYKWSQNKLYLKKRKKKGRCEEGDKKKKSTSLEREHSIINLENDVFVYDAKNRTFTQLDLCECFKNGLKYRKIDPFDTKAKKGNDYELCGIERSPPEDIQQYQNYQLINVEGSMENLFSSQLIKGDHWGKTVNTLCPSKFDLFIQKELNKCTGKNFNVKSFKINTKQESETSSKNKVCSSAAIGYYTITTYDNGLPCDSPINSKGKTMNPKRCNYLGICEEQFHTKKMYSKGLQCKRSYHHMPSKEEKEDCPTNEAGIQCYYAPLHHAEERTKIEPLDPKITEILSHPRKTPPPRQKAHIHKKPLRKKHSSLSDLFPPNEFKNVGNMMQINSSAEIRKILNENNSSSSLTLSNTGEYFRTFLNPRPVMTYYQSSSSSKDNRGDANDDHYSNIRKPVVVITASTPITPICSGPCGTRKRRKETRTAACCCGPPTEKIKTATCNCSCGPSDTKVVGQRRAQKSISAPKLKGDVSLIHEVQEGSPQPPTPDKTDRVKSGCASKCTGPCHTKTTGVACPSACTCVAQKKVERRNPAEPCICKPPPKNACCPCVEAPTSCICDVLCTLKERIKKQTEEQNRNLDQILVELNKQDRELKEIRQFVEKSKRVRTRFSRSSKKCSCYAATVQYDFTTDLKPLPNSSQRKDGVESSANSPEPEIIELFGNDRKFDSKKQTYNAIKKNSWKGLWNRNSDVKSFFVNDIFRKRTNIQKNFSSSTTSTLGEMEKKHKRGYKQWFNNLFGSKKDLTKN